MPHRVKCVPCWGFTYLLSLSILSHDREPLITPYTDMKLVAQTPQILSRMYFSKLIFAIFSVLGMLPIQLHTIYTRHTGWADI